MADTDFNSTQGPTDPASPTPSPLHKGTRSRLIVKIIAGLIVVLVLLTLIAPTLLSTGPVLSIALRKVNEKLTGHVEVSSLSLGWFSGVLVQGVRVFDSTNAQIAQLNRLSIPIPLWKAALGRYDLGNVVCEGLSFDAKYDEKHRLNFEQLVKQSPAETTSAPPSPTPPSTPAGPPTPGAAAPPAKLPSISGNITITDCQGTIAQLGKPTVYLTRLKGNVQIPNINEPITDQLEAGIRVGELKESMLTAEGTAAVVKDNQIDIGAGEVHQKVDLTDLDLSAAGPFLADVKTLGGFFGFHLNVDLTNGKTPGGVTLTASAHDVHYARTTGPAVNEKLIQLNVKGDLNGDDKSTLQQIKNLVVTLKAGDTDAPAIDLLAEVPNATLGGTPSADFRLVYLSADLAKLQKEFAAVPLGQLGTIVNSGVLKISSAGRYDGHLLNINSFNVDADNLYVNRQFADGKQANALAGEGLKVSVVAAADLSRGSGGDGSVEVKTLSVTDAGQIIDIHKDGDGEFLLTLPARGGMSGHGSISLALQLGSLDQIAGVLTQTGSKPAAGGLHSGKLTGTVALVASAQDKTSFAANLNLNDLAINSSSGAVPIQPVNFTFNAATDRSSGTTVVDKANLTSGIATMSLTAPIVVTESAGKRNISGGLKIDGNLSDLSSTLAAYKGKKTGDYPYRGTYSLSENITSKDNGTFLKGGLQLTNFESYNATGTTFSEKQVAIANDLALDAAADDESIAINTLSVAMQSSGALNISINNGSVHHLQTTRDLNLQPTLDYDLAKLWPVIQPIMGDEYKTLKITGQFKKQFNITGSYPANQPSTIAIKTLHADGDLAVATFDYNGLNLQNFIVPFTLDNGKLVTVYANKPVGQNTAAPAVANGGTLDLSNLTIDLTQEPPRLSAPANKLLISKLTINPLFANSFLAKYLNNPVFTGSDASGLMELMFVDCDALPMGSLVTQAVASNTGKADLKLSLTDLNIGFQGISGLASALKQDSFVANVKDGTVAVSRGLSTEHFVFASGTYSINIDGTVRLADEAFVPMSLSVGPMTAIVDRAFGVHDKNVLKYLPDRITVPLKGTVHHASVDMDQTLQRLLAEAGTKAVTNGLLNGNAGNPNDSPLGGLLNRLQKKKKSN